MIQTVEQSISAQKAEQILVIGPAWVGDMVMAQTLFKLLKQERPGVLIDVLAPGATLPLLARMPEVRNAHLMRVGHGQLRLRERRQLGHALRTVAYDQAIVLPNSFKSALVPFWAGIKKRTGWQGEMRWGLLNDMRKLDKQSYPFMIERFMALALKRDANVPAKPPMPHLVVEPQQVEMTLAKLKLTCDRRPILALCPGAEYGPAKRWPTAYFAQVAKQKVAQGWQVWIFGSHKEQPLAAQIQEACNHICRDLTGQTQLTEAIDLLSCAHAVVSNDSGLMHISAALQRPLVVIYGSSDPGFTPPLSKQVKILTLGLDCSPCFKRECPLKHYKCLRDLHPPRVLRALDELLAGAGQHRLSANVAIV